MLSALFLAAALQTLPPMVTGDFNSDGKIDTAEILKTRVGASQLVVHLGGQSAGDVVVHTFPTLNSEVFLDKARAGTLPTWCGKGGGDDDAPCPQRSVTLKGGELMFGFRESSASVVLWTGERFEVVLMSD